MNTFKYIATRVLAALTIAALTGAIGLLILGIGTCLFEKGNTAGCIAGSPGSSPAEFSAGLLMVLYIGGVFGLVLGAPTSIAVMFLTRTRTRPWFAVPRITIGTTLGFLLASSIVEITGKGLFESYLEPIAMIASATLGGIIASRFHPSQQTPDSDARG